eukprot:scaffold12376_cov56-Phaeocystis_antarctica.AAC.4
MAFVAHLAAELVCNHGHALCDRVGEGGEQRLRRAAHRAAYTQLRPRQRTRQLGRRRSIGEPSCGHALPIVPLGRRRAAGGLLGVPPRVVHALAVPQQVDDLGSRRRCRRVQVERVAHRPHASVLGAKLDAAEQGGSSGHVRLVQWRELGEAIARSADGRRRSCAVAHLSRKMESQMESSTRLLEYPP